MNGEDLKAKTRAGGIVYGTMLSVARNPRWAATIAGLGLDYVIIDSEHAPRGRSEIADLSRWPRRGRCRAHRARSHPQFALHNNGP